jgi:hypothetical protein
MTNTTKIQVMKPICKVCGYIPAESWDRICPRDKNYMNLDLVEIEVK